MFSEGQHAALSSNSTALAKTTSSNSAGGRGDPQHPGGGTSSTTTNSKNSMSLEKRAAMWASQHKRKLAERGKAKQMQDAEEMKECTFRPNTSATAESNLLGGKEKVVGEKTRLSALEYEETAEQMFERLHHEADQRNRIRAKAKSLLEESEVSELTFQPQINRGGRQRAKSADPTRLRKPLKDRIEEVQRRKAENVLQTQLEVERSENATFRPKLSAASERLIQKKREEAIHMLESGQDVDGEAALFVQNASERLYQVGKFVGGGGKAGAAAAAAGSAGNHESGGATSKLAPKTDAIVQQSVFFQGPCADFLVRQQTFEDARAQRRELRRKIAEADVKFQPTISKVSEALARTNVRRMTDGNSSWADRMSTQEQKERELRQQKQQQLQLSECTFQPKINPVSSKMVNNKSHVLVDHVLEGGAAAGSRSVSPVRGASTGTTSIARLAAGAGGDLQHQPLLLAQANSVSVDAQPVHERLFKEADNRQKTFVEQLHLKEQEFKKVYSFKPEVRPKTKTHKSSLYAQDKKEELLKTIAETKRRKEIEIEKKKLEFEAEENKNCTFQPKRGTRPPKPQGPIIVNGLSRFLEMKEAAKKKAEEERLAQEVAWGEKPKGLLEKRCGGVTVPKPFHLSQTRDGRRMLRAEQEAEKRLQEYTFAPKTLEGSRAAKLGRILDSEWGSSVVEDRIEDASFGASEPNP